MREIKYEEMKNISGGASAAVITSVVVSVVTFVIGVLSGYSNPTKCQN